MILTAKVSANSLFFLESLAVSQPKTKEMLRVLESVRKVNDNFKKGKIMIALPAAAKNEILASRNLADVKTIEAAKLNVLDLLNTKCLLMPVGAISDIGAIAAKKPAESKKKEAVKIVKTVKKPVNKKK
jgi:Ribosomal protein L4/L1 family.